MGPVRIAIIRLPHLSNFTDFEALERRVPVEYVVPGASLRGFDCIILPGTRRTRWRTWRFSAPGETWTVSERPGSVASRSSASAAGTRCWGRRLIDEGIESGRPGRSFGHRPPGLCDPVPHLRQDHRPGAADRTAGRAHPRGDGDRDRLRDPHGDHGAGEDGEAFDADGTVSADGLVIGTYLHGLFQNESAIRALVGFLYRQKGLEPQPAPEEAATSTGSTADPYEALADLFEAHIDMAKILPLFTGKMTKK